MKSISFPAIYTVFNFDKRNYFILFWAISTLMGCHTDKKSIEHKDSANQVKITIHTPSYKDSTCKLSSFSMLTMEPVTQTELKLDSNGYGLVELSINKPKYMVMGIGDQIITLLLAPGYNLIISDKNDSGNQSLSFSGNGSAANTYLLGLPSVRESFETQHGKNYFELNLVEFQARLDRLEQAYSNFHQNFFKKDTIPTLTQNILRKKYQTQLLSLKFNYALMQGVDQNKDSLFSQFNTSISKDLPLDTALLNLNMMEYAHVLHMYLDLKIYPKLQAAHNLTDVNENKKKLPLLAHREIHISNFQQGIKEFFLAKNIDYWLSIAGITPEIDTIYKDYRNHYSNSQLGISLQERYQKWLTIAAGKPAPNFSGVTPNGQLLSLHDFTGKIVYIDVWATWCSPCMKEIPYSNSLQNKFKGNHNIVFLNVSVDTDEQAWKSVLASEKSFKGVHILDNPPDKSPSSWEAYLISAIPRYILIDKTGKIVQTDAPSPSSGQIENLIHSLMK